MSRPQPTSEAHGFQNVKSHLRMSWPLLALLAVEVIGLARATAGASPPLTPISIATSAIILATGMLPALAHPAPEHTLAGCLATVFAAFLLIPFEPDLSVLMTTGPRPEYFSSYLIYRLINGALIGPLMLHLSSRFPRRSALSNRALGIVYALSAGLLAAFFTTSLPALRKSLFVVMVTWLFVLNGCAVASLLRTSRDPIPEHRRAAQQARLLIFSLLAANSGIILRLILIALLDRSISYNLALAPQIFLPIGIAYAILKHDLFDIDATLRRALAYGALSLILLAGYLGLTVVLTAFLTQVWPQFRGLAAAISLLAAAAAFAPLQARLQSWIDSLLYPDRLKFQEATASARSTLTQVVKREQVIRLLTKEFPESIGCAWGTLSLAPAPDVPGQFQSEPAWNAPLIVGGTSLGRYWLGPRRAGPSFDKEEQAQLNSLAGQAALALAYAGTIEELNRLNRELEARVAERTAQVLAQQQALTVIEERQRLARQLHDSVTQTLFSVNLSARAIRGLLKQDKDTAVDELLALQQSTQSALDEMRSLLHQLRNPEDTAALPKLVDFSQLLEKQCQALEKRHRFHVVRTCPEALLLPRKLADEFLAIIKEALQNAARHSSASEATCQIQQTGSIVQAIISDQGRGFLPDAPSGPNRFGLLGMQERAARLNGKIEINSQPGYGTSVQIEIPLHRN